jgi:hypothetical protein
MEKLAMIWNPETHKNYPTLGAALWEALHLPGEHSFWEDAETKLDCRVINHYGHDGTFDVLYPKSDSRDWTEEEINAYDDEAPNHWIV